LYDYKLRITSPGHKAYLSNLPMNGPQAIDTLISLCPL
jgi:hypothetical protein